MTLYNEVTAHGGHPGGTYWRLQPNDTDGDQYHRQGVLSTQDGIQRGVLGGAHDGGRRCAGGIGNDR